MALVPELADEGLVNEPESYPISPQDLMEAVFKIPLQSGFGEITPVLKNLLKCILPRASWECIKQVRTTMLVIPEYTILHILSSYLPFQWKDQGALNDLVFNRLFDQNMNDEVGEDELYFVSQAWHDGGECPEGITLVAPAPSSADMGTGRMAGVDRHVQRQFHSRATFEHKFR